MSNTLAVIGGGLLFLVAALSLPLFALILLLEVWRNRANIRPNLPRACAAVFSVFAVYILLDKWDGTPFHLDAPIVVSFVVVTQVLARRCQPATIPNS